MAVRPTRRHFLRYGTLAAGVWAAGPLVVRAADNGQWGDLLGRLVYDGPLPPRKKLKVDKDVDCCGKFDIRDESLMPGVDGGLANVFLYLRTRSAAIAPELVEQAAPRVTLDNRDCIFKPHCLTIWRTKQEFHTVNSDPVAQNVAFDPPGDAPCNAVLAVKGSATYTFSRQQLAPVPIKCNYHPWESGYILPRDNPYMAITAADGVFRISRLPAGELEFQVWHERIGFLATPAWAKGRVTLVIKPGVNDLGTIRLAPSLFAEKG